jgi:hypothetical protein
MNLDRFAGKHRDVVVAVLDRQDLVTIVRGQYLGTLKKRNMTRRVAEPDHDVTIPC